MPSPAARQKTIDQLEAAYQALADECWCDGDCALESFADMPAETWNHEPTRQRVLLAATVGFRYALTRRNEMRSDNA